MSRTTFLELSVSTPTSGQLTVVPYEGELCETAEQAAELSVVVRWIAAEKARAEPWHAVVCPNVTGRAKEKIA